MIISLPLRRVAITITLSGYCAGGRGAAAAPPCRHGANGRIAITAHFVAPHLLSSFLACSPYQMGVGVCRAAATPPRPTLTNITHSSLFVWVRRRAAVISPHQPPSRHATAISIYSLIWKAQSPKSSLRRRHHDEPPAHNLRCEIALRCAAGSPSPCAVKPSLPP